MCMYCLQITSPGTWLAKRDDLRLTLKLFGQIRSTRHVSAIFPLQFDEKFTFDKVFLHFVHSDMAMKVSVYYHYNY